jgi:hypothetical protein
MAVRTCKAVLKINTLDKILESSIAIYKIYFETDNLEASLKLHLRYRYLFLKQLYMSFRIH